MPSSPIRRVMSTLVSRCVEFGAHSAMNAFARIVRYEDSRSDLRIEERLSQIVAGPTRERLNVLRSDGALFVQRVTPAGHDKPSGSAGHPLFVASARLDSWAELVAALGLSSLQAGDISDPALLLRLLERWGNGGIAPLHRRLASMGGAVRAVWIKRVISKAEVSPRRGATPAWSKVCQGRRTKSWR